MARKKKYPRLPNGYGSIKKLSGKNRTNPYGVYPPTVEFNENGIPVSQKALCYVDDWYKGFTVLTWYRNGEYYPGREKELPSDVDKLHEQISAILGRFTQTKRELANKKSFKDVFFEYYQNKFGVPYGHSGKKVQMEYSMRAAFKNCSALHDKPFCSLVTRDLQDVLNTCGLKHSSLELIVVLYHQLYDYAGSVDLCDKDYSKFVSIEIEDDDESGVPFTDEELNKLWDHIDDPIVEMIVIMCYSGFRIAAYTDMTVDLEGRFFYGGVKTDAGKCRYVPIHSAILPLVKKRLSRDEKILKQTPGAFRTKMYKALNGLGIERHTPHDCRHTFNSLCDHFEVPENDAKEMLGHTFPDITKKVYRHRRLEDLRAKIELIQAPPRPVTNVSLID